jgi:YggT family protein
MRQVFIAALLLVLGRVDHCSAAFAPIAIVRAAAAAASAAAAHHPMAAPSKERRRCCPPHQMMMDPWCLDVATATWSSSTSGTVLLAETEAWVQPAQLFLDPFLNLMSLAMLARVVLSWYPETKITDFPWIALVLPTEPLLRVVKGVVPPAFGVDITPVFWLAIFTFVHEILLGQQGLLTMKIKYGM